MEKRRKQTRFSLFFDVVEKIELGVSGIALAGIFLVVMVQIFGRLFGKSPSWTEEGTRCLFLWMMWIALAAGFNRSESSRVVVLLKHLPRALQIVCNLFYIIFSIGVFAFVVYYGIFLVQQQITMGEMGAALRIPMYTIGAAVPIGGVCGIIGVIRNALEEMYLIDVAGNPTGGEEQ